MRIFATSDRGGREEITDLYWFEENGVHDWGGQGHYNKYTFEFEQPHTPESKLAEALRLMMDERVVGRYKFSTSDAAREALAAYDASLKHTTTDAAQGKDQVVWLIERGSPAEYLETILDVTKWTSDPHAATGFSSRKEAKEFAEENISGYRICDHLFYGGFNGVMFYPIKQQENHPIPAEQQAASEGRRVTDADIKAGCDTYRAKVGYACNWNGMGAALDNFASTLPAGDDGMRRDAERWRSFRHMKNVEAEMMKPAEWDAFVDKRIAKRTARIAADRCADELEAALANPPQSTGENEMSEDEPDYSVCPRCHTVIYPLDEPHNCAPPANVNDRQEGGSHYGPGTNFQHWDWVVTCKMQYLEGCCTKYVIRKKGNRVEDLKKAVHYIDKIIDLATNQFYVPALERPDFLTLSSLCKNLRDAYNLSDAQHDVCYFLARWTSIHDLHRVRQLCYNLLQKADHPGARPVYGGEIE